MTGRLTAIHIYPVKSCRAVALQSVEVTRRGLAGDRLLQVVDAASQPVTQRQQPRLATVQPTLDDGDLILEADGQGRLRVPIPIANDTTATSLLGVPVEAADAGDGAAAWFSDLLGTPVRVVAMTDESDYRIPAPGQEMALSWADGSSVLIANDQSLRWLTRRAGEPFAMDRFRPNLTVDAPPWSEDTWREVSVGEARFGFGLAWPRCAIPQIDQLTGDRTKEPARVLKAHRWCASAPSMPESLRSILEGNALFGIGCSVDQMSGAIAVGDDVVVHRTGQPIIEPPIDQ